MTLPHMVSVMVGLADNAEAASKPAALELALKALQTYDFGSDRFVLTPLDEAVRESLIQPNKRLEMEQRLLKAFRENLSVAAKEYLCSKLTLVGSAASAQALGELLAHEKLSHPACSTLQAIGGTEVAQLLRDKLKSASGMPLLGIITALGQMRDPESVDRIARLLSSADTQVVKASADALGHIANPESAKAILDFHPKAPATIQAALSDACLVCANRLSKAGNKGLARQVYSLLLKDNTPSYIKAAAQSGIDQLN